MNGATGTPAIPVGTRPGGAPPRIDSAAIPAELKAPPQWVNWRFEHRPGAPKPTKPPLNPNTGTLASVDDPATWGTFEQALHAYEGGLGDGVGFVFTREGRHVGVDLDGCRDPATGVIEPCAQRIIDLLDCYSEVSPSGTGIHIIALGALPPEGRRKGPVEMYCEGRFFTMTGQRLPGTPATVQERLSQLLQLHRETFGPEPSPRRPARPVSAAPVRGDDEVVSRAMSARNGVRFRRLWEGDATGYPSCSEADLALCSALAFWSNADPAAIDRLFRRSGLMRPKWDRGAGAQTYGQRTISKALASPRPFLRPKGGIVVVRVAL